MCATNPLISFVKLSLVSSGIAASAIMCALILRSVFMSDFASENPMARHAVAFVSLFAVSAAVYVVFTWK